MNAIAYFRTVESTQVSNMKEAFIEYCKFNMHLPKTIFADIGCVEKPPYPEYQRMIKHLRNNKSLIVVPDSSHLGTDLESVTRSTVELESVQSKVICYDNEFHDPLRNALQKFGTKGVSRSRSLNIKQSMRIRALDGKALGKPLYGYRIGSDGTLQISKPEAAVVELIFRLYTHDKIGFRLITQYLNKHTILTRAAGKWSVSTIRDILRNSTYTGTYTRFGMRRPKAHASIIPSNVFRNVQEQIRKRRPISKVATSNAFLLSGFAYCSYCGNKMMGVTRRQSWKRKDGVRRQQIYRYYQCQSRNNQSVCDYHTWRAPLLEKMALSQLKYTFSVIKKMETQPRAHNKTRDVRENEVINAERRFLRAIQRTARGNIGIRTLGNYLTDLDSARDVARNTTTSHSIEETLNRWDSLEFQAKREFLWNHLVKIMAQDNSVQILV